MNKHHQQLGWVALCAVGITSCQQQAVHPVNGRWQILAVTPVAGADALATLKPLEAAALAVAGEAVRPTYLTISDKLLTLVNQANDSTSLAYSVISTQNGVFRLRTPQGEGRIDQAGEDRATLVIAGARYELTRKK